MARGGAKRPPKPRTPSPADPAAQAIQRAGAWWNADLATIPENRRVGVVAAMGDVAIMALGHIAKRLANPELEDHIKDKLALRCTPLASVQIRLNGHSEAPRTATDAPDPDVALLDAYDITPDQPAN